jgi:hypothetical protein
MCTLSSMLQGESCEVVVVFRPSSQRPYYEDELQVSEAVRTCAARLTKHFLSVLGLSQMCCSRVQALSRTTLTAASGIT